jgi:nitroimidazol reductase NimA-like FMN-containing flavoprotein (pyridoxamine 5'-phosphate oxidase superfamily)
MSTTLTPSSAPAIRRPRITALSVQQTAFVLARNCVARIAFCHDGRVELIPIHYAYLDGAIVGRIAMGAKYLQWLVVSDVVMEVDEVHSLYDWRSVVVRGKLALLSAKGTQSDRAAYTAAVDAIRSVIPTAFTENDPTPERSFVFRVDPSEVTGRQASTKR